MGCTSSFWVEDTRGVIKVEFTLFVRLHDSGQDESANSALANDDALSSDDPVVSKKSDDHESRELFLLSNKSIHKIRLPEAYDKQCRSSCGWLLTVGEDFALKLINPLSREIINLPTVDTFPDAIHPLYIFDRYAIKAWNVNGKDPAVMVDGAITPEDVVMTLEYGYYSAYIVGLDDSERKQLLLIIQKGTDYTKSFQVLAYDLQSRNWSKVTDFGTKTLFVRYTSSFWVEDTTGVIKGNCIYYTNGIGGDTGIYHLLDGTIEPHFAGDSLSHVTPPLQSM
nr:hypothetical protein [Tanacetum cinerariifolium]